MLSTICDYWLLISINFILIVIYSKTCYHFVRTILSIDILSVYHFVRTILPVPFCPMTFCPYIILSVSFCPYHFVRYHFVCTILSAPFCPLPFCPYHFVRTILSATILSGHHQKSKTYCWSQFFQIMYFSRGIA